MQLIDKEIEFALGYIYVHPKTKNNEITPETRGIRETNKTFEENVEFDLRPMKK